MQAKGNVHVLIGQFDFLLPVMSQSNHFDFRFRLNNKGNRGMMKCILELRVISFQVLDTLKAYRTDFETMHCSCRFCNNSTFLCMYLVGLKSSSYSSVYSGAPPFFPSSGISNR